MERLYREGHSLNQVAHLTCTTLGQVHWILKKRGVPMRPKGSQARQPDGKGRQAGRPMAGPPPWLDKAAGLYEGGMGLDAIAEVVGSSGMTVRRHLLRAGVEMRPSKGRGRPKGARAATAEPAPGERENDPMVKAEFLYREGMTIDEVAEAVGLNRSTVGRKLRERGVPMRPVGQRPGPDWKPGKPRKPAGPPAWLDDAIGMYEGGMTLVEIGDIVGSSNMTVRKHLVAARVKIRPRGGVRNRPKAAPPTVAEIKGAAKERVRCPTCRGNSHPGVKRPGYGWMPIWMMYPGGEGWAL